MQTVLGECNPDSVFILHFKCADLIDNQFFKQQSLMHSEKQQWIKMNFTFFVDQSVGVVYPRAAAFDRHKDKHSSFHSTASSKD